MALILQGNLGRSRLAQDLLDQFSRDRGAELLILSEQYRTLSDRGWYSDRTGTAAIVIRSVDKFPVSDTGNGVGYVWIRSGGVTYMSCYLSPNITIGVFREQLADLEDALRVCGDSGDLVLAGDLNSKATDWGGARTDPRGRAVMEMAARLDLTVLNSGDKATFRRVGTRGSVIDVTLASPQIAARVSAWTLLEDYTASDHQFIEFRIEGQRGRSPYGVPRRRSTGWNVARLDRDALREALARAPPPLDLNTITGPADAERFSGETMDRIRGWCDECMPKRRSRSNREPNYWWTEEIADLRKECQRLRRVSQRYRRRGEAGEALTAYKEARKSLVRAIKTRKSQCWRELIADIDRDVWGMGYRIVQKRLRAAGSVGLMEPSFMKETVDTLFPDHPRERREEIPTCDVPLFEPEELLTVASGLPGRKAPGPDGVPSEVLKIVATVKPHVLLDMFNACLRVGIFSKRWKIQRLVLLDKGKPPPLTPSSFRPLCMLDNAGKILEKMIRARLREGCDLSDNQYGFREGRSTCMAIGEVLGIVKEAWKAPHKTRSACVLVTLDVKNAFNSARWPDIREALRKQEVPNYLRKVLDNYLQDRVLRYDTTEGPREKRVTSGVAQGSALGPDLWNLVYDGLLRLEMPPGVKLIGFADDVILVVTARSREEAERRISWAIVRVAEWLRGHGFELAAQKTEMVVLTRQRWFGEGFRLNVAGAAICASPAVRYLGVWIDSRLTFGEHIRRTAEKATRVAGALSRLMPNVGGPREAKRRILASVANSILLYGAEVWADALTQKSLRARITSVQRVGSLRIACAYRTVSAAAVLVIARTVPVVLLARERREKFLSNGSETDDDRRARSVLRWQQEWDAADVGRWTHRLIPQLSPWLERGHGEVNYYLTQLLSGHGQFNAYLSRMGVKASSRCDYCPAVDDTPEHTFFACDRWGQQRELLRDRLSVVPTPENIVPAMLKCEDAWRAVNDFAQSVIREKKKEEPGFVRPA